MDMLTEGQKHQKKILTNTGFSLIELIVVLAIISILTGIVLANYRDFQKRIVLENLTQDVALSVRLAQSYGLNVRRTGPSGGFDTSYGIHFDRTTPTEYVLFRDPNRSIGGFNYDIGIDIDTFNLGGGYSISEVCASGGVGGTDCFSGSMTDLDMVFDRPDPDANISSNLRSDYGRVVITVADPLGNTRTVEVLATGFISIQ